MFIFCSTHFSSPESRSYFILMNITAQHTEWKERHLHTIFFNILLYRFTKHQRSIPCIYALVGQNWVIAWWRHQMKTFSALLVLCAGNSTVTGKFPSQRPVTRSFDVVFDLCLNKWLSKQLWGWWFETPSRSLWRHSNGPLILTQLWPIVACLKGISSINGEVSFITTQCC